VSALKVGIAALVVGAIGVVGILLSPSWFPSQAAVQAERQDTLYLVLMIISAFIFAIVVTFLVYSMWTFRAKPGDMSDGPPIHGHTVLEIVWTLIPTVIVVTLAVYGGIVLARNESKSPDRLHVRVVGEQFAWSFHYPGDVKSGVLYLPVGRETEFDTTSLTNDVIHSFFVPQFRIKADAVPGLINRTYATPTKTGTYEVVCAELCGIGHGQMRAVVMVVSQSAFDSWLSQQQAATTGGSG
jgi:cytochrome c oxidase subunit II